jgi:hypothetical protein
MKDSNFPTSKKGKAAYFAVVFAYLIANATRLLIAPADIAALTSLYGDITTLDTYLYWWTKWTNPKVTRTTLVSNNLVIFEEKMIELLRTIYDNIPARLWSEEARVTLNRKTGAPLVRIHPTTPVGEQCNGTGKQKAGGVINLEFRFEGDSSRPSKPPNADAVLIHFRVAAKYLIGTDLSGKVRNLPIGPKDAGMKEFISTKAKFTVNLGIENQDMELQYYSQWINTRHRELDGPVCGPFFITVL